MGDTLAFYKSEREVTSSWTQGPTLWCFYFQDALNGCIYMFFLMIYVNCLWGSYLRNNNWITSVFAIFKCMCWHSVLQTFSPVAQKCIRQPSGIWCTHSVFAFLITTAGHQPHRSPELSPNIQKYVAAALCLPPFLVAVSTKETQSDFLLRVSILLHTPLPHRVDLTVVSG